MGCGTGVAHLKRLISDVPRQGPGPGKDFRRKCRAQHISKDHRTKVKKKKKQITENQRWRSPGTQLGTLRLGQKGASLGSCCLIYPPPFTSEESGREGRSAGYGGSSVTAKRIHESNNNNNNNNGNITLIKVFTVYLGPSKTLLELSESHISPVK